MLVSDAGSRWDLSSFLSVGTRGTGSLQVQAGGSVTNTDALVGDITGTGFAIIDGADSNWSSSGTTVIASTGNGTMTVSNGGHVITSLSGRIGLGTGAFGMATVTGPGSRWDMLGQQLIVGAFGSGSMLISNGGIVTSKKGPSGTSSAGIIGREGNAVGTVTVTGPGSRWDMSDGNLNVGFGSIATNDFSGGTGFLNVTSGGVVTSINGYIGRAAGGVGTAIIGGTGTGSAWTMSGSLFIGGDDTNPAGSAGTLIINAGGTVVAPTRLKAWNIGHIRWNGGSLRPRRLN